MQNPSFTIDFGPMFSGKSQELIRRCSKVTDAIASSLEGQSNSVVEEVLLITDKHQSERNTASSIKGITTHTFNFNPSPYLKIREVYRLEEIKDVGNVRLIGIDEGFYPDLEEKVLYWFIEKRISISIACIDGSFEQKNILPQVYNLIPYATKVIKHSAYCYKCLQEKRQENAFYTIKMNGEMEAKKEYGGKDLYRPVCLTHLIEHRRK